MNFSLVTARRGLLSSLMVCSGLVRAQAPPAADAATSIQRFDVFEFRIEGNTVLTNELIERAVYPFMGDGRTIDDVEGARVALEKAYHDRGFATVVVDLPPQKVEGATVVFNVVEGRVARLRVTGARYFSQSRILETVPALAEGSVPQMREVQKQLVAVNTTLDKRVTPLLRPGKEPGTTEVDLQVDDQRPLHGSVELNNQNAPHTTPMRLLASLRYANLFQLEHTAGLQIQSSPQNTSEVKVIAGSYSLPAWSGTLAFSAVRSDSNSFVGGGVGVFGKGEVYGMRYLLPMESLPAPNEVRHSLSLGIDYKRFDQNLVVGAEAGSGIQSPIRYAPLSLNYSGVRTDESGMWDFGVGWMFTFRGLASSDQQFADKRYQAHSNFAILSYNLTRTQMLSRDYSLHAGLAGQISGQPLVSNEQFLVGGVDTVRGYLESSQAGDSGLRGTLELRSPNLISSEHRDVEFFQWRVFVDAAHVSLRAPLPGTQASYQLASTGAGVTVKSKGGLSLKADLALPLRDTLDQDAYKPRLHASALYEF
jgi:hemolysin activation/secretion protein